MAPSSLPTTAFSIVGPFGSTGEAFPQVQPSSLYQSQLATQSFVGYPSSAQVASAAAAVGAGLNPIYARNIAAACEAANHEAAQKQKETTKGDDEEIQRKRATSRITAWQSRERKRIEMEVLQERQVELTRRNADLKSENEQLRLLILNLKSVVANPVAPRPFAEAQPFSGSSSLRIGRGRSTTVAHSMDVTSLSTGGESHQLTQPNLQAHSVSFPSSQPFYGYPSMSGPPTTAEAFASPFLQQQAQIYQQHQPFRQQNQPFGISLEDLAGLQQRVQLQQRPGNHPMSFAAGTFASQEAATQIPLGLPDAMTPLARHNSAISENHGDNVDVNRHAIPPQPPLPEDASGAYALDITSLLLPPGNFQVNVPLIRAVPKRKDNEDTKHNSPEKKKGTG